MSFIKICKGCGSPLHSEYPVQMGYAKNMDQDYCQRCFRLTHYGDDKLLKLKNVTNKEVLNIYDKYQDELFVLIVEAFDALVFNSDYLLDIFKDKKLILVINKIDLLPRNISEDKIERLFTSILSKTNNTNIKACLMTYKNDSSFKDLFYETLDELKERKVVFAGRVNAGKSSLINKLCGNNDLTISTYPGTTLVENEISLDKYTFIDTPGLNDEESFVSHLSSEKIKQLITLKTIKAKTYQAYSNQSYLIEGLMCLDCETNKTVSLTFYINNELEVHRTKMHNANDYLLNHEAEFSLKLLPFKDNKLKINKSACLYLKGLGYIKIVGDVNINIRLNKSIKVYECEVEL